MKNLKICTHLKWLIHNESNILNIFYINFELNYEQETLHFYVQ